MIESGLAKASSDFLITEDDPLIITGRLFDDKDQVSLVFRYLYRQTFVYLINSNNVNNEL